MRSPPAPGAAPTSGRATAPEPRTRRQRRSRRGQSPSGALPRRPARPKARRGRPQRPRRGRRRAKPERRRPVVERQAVSPASRRRARSGPISGRSPASSGPWSRPVSARRSGMNSARPLAPVAALTASVQLFQVEPSQGSAGSSSAALATKPLVRDHRRAPDPATTGHHCTASATRVEIGAHREPERLAAADRRAPRDDP